MPEKALLNEVVHWIDGWLKKNPEGDIIKNIKTRLKEIALGNEGCVLNEYQYQKGKTNYSTIVPLFSLWAGQLSITCELRG